MIFFLGSAHHLALNLSYGRLEIWRLFFELLSFRARVIGRTSVFAKLWPDGRVAVPRRSTSAQSHHLRSYHDPSPINELAAAKTKVLMQ
jgi:hypothetical protein